MFVRDKGIKEVTVNYPTTSKLFKNLNRGYFIELGYLDKEVEIGLRNDTNEDQLLVEIFRFNFETLKKVVNAINENAKFTIKSFREDRIYYTMDVRNKGVCTISLPYDKGFTVLVDGNKVETKKVMDFLLGFDIDKGMHEIVVTYVPDGFVLGTILSAVGILALILLLAIDKTRAIIKKQS